MRRSRRGGGSGVEFGSSGEDSFVAVVVTKLTGALLFILLLTMVIMALLPKAVDVDQVNGGHSSPATETNIPLQITTPSRLPEAIAGRTYAVALAATGGRGRLQWSTAGPIPGWLALDGETGQLSGTPPKPTDEPIAVAIEVSDGTDAVSQGLHLAVLPAQSSETSNPWWRPRFSRVDLGTWLEQGVGCLLLWLIHLLGMNLLANLERNSIDRDPLEQSDETGRRPVQKRYAAYRLLVRLTTLTAMAALAIWMVMNRRT
jgi:preprotein translocase subunit SecG